ncbi:hypothetical protein HRR83_005797 [Exophiala dermatitidis]|uniref:Phenylacetaldoxime dehydratase n=2 Tax=Exophiala dermatitidis TaxID=5970 RepID=H6BUX5_EXODN|nr:phenylacetaldoxime dehydratase [Exophiala dermatitidis NIH/UT8656]KAJ4508705.1 hypothetical protein HRR73_007372 [Exophiala dermatitidis]EHY54945.1 phenylacetaldoxime dehydratase [Exophiala dermatitidis NIH/UT8656]KAJ4510954.1 hypothetical protein HRR75_005648 [Exophiala dermatitidis]KAJ4513353.1 hypothetical protein HRR74_006165 [Exophiala dermatitidis]KAJ4538095.1 hypothetical protein HRR77_007135 [Exophiala dermatitidis]
MSPVRIEKRHHSLKRPPNHKVSNPRWTVVFPDHVEHVCTLYLGVQCHAGDMNSLANVERIINEFLNHPASAAESIEVFRVILGNDLPASKVWIAHWTRREVFSAMLEKLNLPHMWQELGSARKGIGLWRESFVTPRKRLQTNYSRLEYKPGLARLKSVAIEAHDNTEYWGAGRDRLEASSNDLFELPSTLNVNKTQPEGFGQRLFGVNYDNMCHIRSGQYWGLCGPEERDAYENGLQKQLVRGMRYLWENPEETGTIGLRFGRRLATYSDKRNLRETSAFGFHRNWADLEKWASRHPSHLDIFTGAMKHNKRFGEARRFMTWQEVSILKAGEASFEYINCNPRTGVIQWVDLAVQPLMSMREIKL